MIEKINREKNKRDIKKSLVKIGKTLIKSKTLVSIAVKFRLAELIFHLMKRKRPFGLFVILGWQNKWRKFTDLPDVHQDIFCEASYQYHAYKS